MADGHKEKKMRPADVVEYDMLLDQLAESLKIARHPDSSITIKAARLLIEKLISSTRSSCPSLCQQGGQNNTPEGEKGHEGEGGDRSLRFPHAHTNQSAKRDDKDKLLEINDVQLPKKLLHCLLSSGLSADDGITGGSNNNEDPLTTTTAAQPSSESSESMKRRTMAEVVQQGGGGGGSSNKCDADKKDETLALFERASSVLKLLYLDDQRHLQNRVNEIISSIQSLTANPKTDTRLLKTGR